MRFIHQPQTSTSKNILPLFTVLIFGINLLALTLLIFNASMLNGITSRLPQVLGQLADGRGITLTPQPHSQRHPESIRRFVGETLTLMFTWSKNHPPQTVLNFSLGLLAQNLRNRFLSEISPEGRGDNIESVFLIQSISQPQELKTGVWQLTVNGRRIVFLNQDKNGKSQNWQKNVIVEVVDSSPIPLTKPVNSLHQAVHELSKMQLSIVNICEIGDKNCMPN